MVSADKAFIAIGVTESGNVSGNNHSGFKPYEEAKEWGANCIGSKTNVDHVIICEAYAVMRRTAPPITTIPLKNPTSLDSRAHSSNLSMQTEDRSHQQDY